MRYGDSDVGWLFDTLEGLAWRVSPLDVIETERRYPGLMTDLGIEGWQRRLVKDQLSGGKKDAMDG